MPDNLGFVCHTLSQSFNSAIIIQKQYRHENSYGWAPLGLSEQQARLGLEAIVH